MYPHKWVTQEEIKSVESELSGLWVHFMQKETIGTTYYLLRILGPNCNLLSKTTCLAEWLPKKAYLLMWICQEITDMLLLSVNCLISPLKKLFISFTENSF